MPTYFAGSAALLLAFLPCARGQTTYRVTEVPLALGGHSAAPVNLTDNGQIAFNAGAGAFVWSPAGLRSLPPLPGFQGSQVFKVQDDGRAFGSCSKLGPTGYVYSSVAVTWTADGVAHRLRQDGTFETGAAVDANALGQVVGFASLYATQVAAPELWQQQVQVYLPIPGGSYAGRTSSINDHSMIVGSAVPPGSLFARPVVWSSPHSSFFPNLPMDAIGGELLSVNNAGQAVGFGTTWSTYNPMWYDANGLRMLGVPAGYDAGFLRTINRSGQAVGWAYSYQNGNQSGILLIGGQLQLIGDLLDPVTGAGWSIQDLPGLNNAGQIAAVGRRTVAPFNSAILLLDPLP